MRKCRGSAEEVAAADQARPLAAGRAQAAADPASLIISHGGSHDSLAHWRALESSAKPFRHSDRGEPLSSREKFGAGIWIPEEHGFQKIMAAILVADLSLRILLPETPELRSAEQRGKRLYLII